MPAMHMEITAVQSSKKTGDPCGDCVFIDRDEKWTTIALIDGIGSGLRANLAATMAGNRLMELLRRGFSLQDAFGRLVETMNRSRDIQLSFAAFSVARIRLDGQATILSYEAPSATLLQPPFGVLLDHDTFTVDRAILSEATCQLALGQGLLLVSDGITQAGLGKHGSSGWGEAAMVHEVENQLQTGAEIDDLPEQIHNHARQLWGASHGDDCSVIAVRASRSVEVDILTGPPSDSELSGGMMTEFLDGPGVKVVCGGSTAQMVADHLCKPLTTEPNPQSMITPPRYRVEGINLLTEGAITLNHVHNILDVDVAEYQEDSGATELASLLQVATRVNLYAGLAVNPSTADISYRQQGIAPRKSILPLLIDKLRAHGKLIVPKYY